MKFFEGEIVAIGRLIQKLADADLIDLMGDGRMKVKADFKLDVNSDGILKERCPAGADSLSPAAPDPLSA